MDGELIAVPRDRVAGIRSDREAVRAILQDPAAKRLNLEDAWAGIHYVLTAELPFPKHKAMERGISWRDDSLDNVLMGGDPVPYNSGFGPARLLLPEAVQEHSARLDQISAAQFGEWYEPDDLTSHGIPPERWDEPGAREWLIESYKELRDFYKTAAEAGDGILIVI